MPRARLEAERLRRVEEPWPGGESWRSAIERVDAFLVELAARHAPSERVLLIGHMATRFALEARTTGTSLRELIDAPFRWRPGWEYDLGPAHGDNAR